MEDRCGVFMFNVNTVDILTLIGISGVNEKFIGKRLSDNKLGIVKFPLISESYDCINEVVCYELGKLFGFDVADASIESYKNRECIISCYDSNDKYFQNNIKSLKSILGTERFHSRFNTKWLIENYGQDGYKKFVQMLMFDYITRQEDRHISNIAFTKETMYSLYDNGRSLFFDSYHILKGLNFNNYSDITDTFVNNEHGFNYLYLEDIVGRNVYRTLINRNVTYNQILDVFDKYYSDKERAKLTATYVYSVYRRFI